ncbi:hypothetical protein GIB67_006882 [Kingdonia uniflora]|uniref:non-specific serine/threonine protein kinase n=1 Tax=Kingdonia uniflora TaxID=39325 RepID=A0A7J7L033_9MAGN|nr:hypothetical protein GIB67_006882 [Kingdonia uniflora]
MEKGSLDYILFDNYKNLEWEKLHEIAIGTAKGPGYLHHDCDDIIIHYDIMPGNVLLDSKFSPKVTDFGLAMLCNREITHVSMTCGRGTPAYAAPELWMPTHITYKCDVYSYGITLFEIALGKMKLDATMSESQLPRRVWEKFKRGELSDFMRDFGIKDGDKTKAVLFCTVALWCIQYLPEARPSMIRVVQMLEGMVEVMTPPNPFQHLISTGVNLAVSKQTTSRDSTRSTGIRRTSSKECTPIIITLNALDNQLMMPKTIQNCSKRSLCCIPHLSSESLNLSFLVFRNLVDQKYIVRTSWAFANNAAHRPNTAPIIVHVSLPVEIEGERKNRLTVMMEQEVKQTINESSAIVIFGETGCGKTTQDPQNDFLLKWYSVIILDGHTNWNTFTCYTNLPDLKEKDKVLIKTPGIYLGKYFAVQKWVPFTPIEVSKIKKIPI